MSKANKFRWFTNNEGKFTLTKCKLSQTGQGSKSSTSKSLRGAYFVMIMEYYGVCIPLLVDSGRIFVIHGAVLIQLSPWGKD